MPLSKPKKVGRPKLPKGAAKGKFVGLRFEPEYLKRIDAAAKAGKQSRSDWIRSILTAAIGG
jgi:predicted HicB family RNase H-like nuclease